MSRIIAFALLAAMLLGIKHAQAQALPPVSAQLSEVLHG